MKIPTHPFSLMKSVYRDVMPIVHKQIAYWKKKAEAIPDKELRAQALSSIQAKLFHCEGGSILGILAKEHLEECIKFVVAYQTISDYLDNLCDRSNSLDPVDFRELHHSMRDALTIGIDTKNYYQFRDNQDDGGYLAELVKTCQHVLAKTAHYHKIQPFLLELAEYYCDLQVHKHVTVEERVPRLEKWFEQHKENFPEMEWFEFSACTGSTLGIFCLVSYAFQSDFNGETATRLKRGYFPYVQGLHILLDYFIDQEEDRRGGDLNFCFYYSHDEKLLSRIKHFVTEADRSILGLPNEQFHRLIYRGLLGIYLADEKIYTQNKVTGLAKRIIKFGGFTSYFFYMNAKAYRKYKKVTYALGRKQAYS